MALHLTFGKAPGCCLFLYFLIDFCAAVFISPFLYTRENNAVFFFFEEVRVGAIVLVRGVDGAGGGGGGGTGRMVEELC